MGGNDEYTTAKYISKRMKARGLQKLRFYCQVCQKQCRDANGFNSHTKSSSHLNKILQVTEADIEAYTLQFQHDFLQSLKLNHGEKYISANKFYNEFIQDRDHVHMNATRFTSLSNFVKYLSTNGLVRVKLETFSSDHDDDEGNRDRDLAGDIDMGSLLISYIDRSSENVLHKQKIKELEATEKTEQEIRNYLLQRQIEKSEREEEEAKETGSKDDNNGNGVTQEQSLREAGRVNRETEETLAGVRINLHLNSKINGSSSSNMINKKKVRKNGRAKTANTAIIFK